MDVIWQPKAAKQFRKIGDKKVQGRILDGTTKLEAWPDCQNIKALSNHRYAYRLRVADWRVFFDLIDGEPTILSIEEVKKRDERTY